MNEKTKNPITLVADLLADMTERAMEAERQRDVAKKDSDNWYRLYQDKTEQLKIAEQKVAALREYIETMKKGETEKKGEVDNA